MNKKILFLLCCLTIALFACANTSTPTQEQEQEIPRPTTPTQETEPAQEPSEPVVVEPSKTMDAAVQTLIEKGSARTNYAFTYAQLPEGRAETAYLVRGNYIRVDPRLSTTRSVDSIDTIYLDLEKKLAIGYCVRGTSSVCQDKTKLADLDFNDYYVELPHEVIRRLDNGERIQTVSYRSHTSDVVKAFLDGQETTLTIHQFQGLPLKVAYADTTGFEYREISFGTVSEQDVTPPAGW